MSSCRDLDVWKLARALATDIHAMPRWDTRSLRDRELFDEPQARPDQLGRKMSRFIQRAEREHQSGKGDAPHPASRIPHPVSS